MTESQGYFVMFFLGILSMYMAQQLVRPAHADYGISASASRMADALDRIEKKITTGCK